MANRDFRIRQGLMVGDSDLHFSLVGGTSLKLKTGAGIFIGDNAVIKAGDNISTLTNNSGYLTASNVASILADNESDSTKLQAIQSTLDSLKTDFTSRLDSDSSEIGLVKGKVAVIETRLDSDHALFQGKVAAGLLNLADSDLLSFQLDQKVAALIGRLDSDSIVQQTIKTQVYPRLDSDRDDVQAFKSDTRARLDSDSARIQALGAGTTADTAALRADLDSDSVKIQLIQQSLNDLNARATIIDSESISTMIDSEFINSRLHFTENGVFAVDSEGELMVLTGSDTIDSVGNAITTLRQDRDSDTGKIQTIQGKIGEFQSRLDSDDPRISALKTEFTARLDSDSSVNHAIITSLITAQNLLKARADSDDSAIQAVSTKADVALSRLDSDETKLQSLQKVVDQLRIDLDSDDALIGSFTGGVTLGVNAANTGGMAVIEPHLLTTTSTNAATALTHATGAFKGMKLLVTIANTVSGERQVSELLITHDGTNTAFTEYGIVYTGALPLSAIDVDINGGNVRLRVTSTSAQSTTYTIIEQYTI